MSTPINLNKARKARARAEKKERADSNAVKFGRSKAERQLDSAQKAKDARDHEGHKRER